MVKNPYFGQKHKFWPKTQILAKHTKIQILANNTNFGEKYKFLRKIQILTNNLFQTAVQTAVIYAIQFCEFLFFRPGDENDRKWSNYGCYCLPTQGYTEDINWIGYGAPVDDIDRLCQKLLHCYQCLEKTYAKCSASIPYAWRSDTFGDMAGGKFF